jgi:nitrate/nitrite-specific signal transduction histidine kinase
MKAGRKPKNSSRKQPIQTSIRTRLLYSFMLLALLPLLAASIGSLVLGYVNGEQETYNQFSSIADLKKLEIQTWADAVHNELYTVMSERYALDRAQVVLQLTRNQFTYDAYNNATRFQFQKFIENSNILTRLTLVDMNGNAVLSSDLDSEKQNLSDQSFYRQGLYGYSIQVLPGASLTLQDAVVAAMPIFTRQGSLVGLLVGNADPDRIQQSLMESTAIGNTGKIYLVSTANGYIGGSDMQAIGTVVHSTGIDRTIASQQDSSGIYRNYLGKRVFGVYRWLPELHLTLVIEQDLSEVFSAITTNLLVNIAITVIVLVLAGIAALLITRSISTPLEDLVQTAEQIAQGDLERTATVERKDEIGALATTFNQMTGRLRELIGSLENRVAERTGALQRRAHQLETISTMSREITSILDIQALLARVVELIHDSFSYSHVSIYLLEEEGQLMLQAFSGQHPPFHSKLDIVTPSLNGRAVQIHSPVRTGDTANNPDFLFDPAMPDTQSELVVPLLMGTNIIGTLDVHSNQKDAFTDDDVLVIQSLGDQVAVAIENARRYDSSRRVAVLEERDRLARDLHDSVIQALYSLQLVTGSWRPVIRDDSPNVDAYFTQINQTLRDAIKEMRLLIYELRPPVLEQEGLLGALHYRLDAVERRAGMETHLSAEDFVELPQEVEQGLYWIVQEALNNTLKHSGATKVEIRLFFEGHKLVLEIADNGAGFNLDSSLQRGLGLASMHERAGKLGSLLEIETKPGAGTCVRVKVRYD